MRVVLLVALTLLISGCLRSDVDSKENPLATSAPISYDGSGCDVMVAVFTMTFEDAATLIPEGFVPADASGLLGTPAPTGRAAAILEFYDCATHEMVEGAWQGAEIDVLVEDPGIDDNRQGPAGGHFYQVVVYQTAPETEALLEDAGWTYQHADELALTITGGAQGTATLVTPDVRISLNGIGFVPNTLEGTNRFWHVTPYGPAWMDFTIGATMEVGGGSFQGEGLPDVFYVGSSIPVPEAAFMAKGVGWEAYLYPARG